LYSSSVPTVRTLWREAGISETRIEKEGDKYPYEMQNAFAKEFNQTELPIVTNMDFGHTDPRFILPMGITAEIDCRNKKFGLLEPAVA
jgi:muramoyltetrapeptide carboxypeptidase LdcA involved in peptidoglycan recycling